MSSKKIRLAVFASGSGTNAEEIFKYFKDHDSIDVVLLLSNNPDALALQRAAKFGIPNAVFTREDFKGGSRILTLLRDSGVTHIVLAGFLWLIPAYLVEAYANRIINIHPALLPRYGGKGMYGAKVHEAVKAAGDTESGITIHLVNEHYDEGKILFQKRCPIASHHTPDDIAACIHALEYEHYPRVIEEWVIGKSQASSDS